jgi:hypothetical protein
MTSRLGRIIAVTVGLSVAGAIFGALAAVMGLVVLTVLSGGGAPMLDMAVIPAILGASLGAVGAPAIAWLLLRYVPLGKAIAWSTVGTAAGGVVGWLLATVLDRASPGIDTAVGSQVRGAILGAIAGFLAAALILRLRAARGKASSTAGRPVA